jgi:hypothetical protein
MKTMNGNSSGNSKKNATHRHVHHVALALHFHRAIDGHILTVGPFIERGIAAILPLENQLVSLGLLQAS